MSAGAITGTDAGELAARTASHESSARGRLLALGLVGALLAILAVSLFALLWDGVGVWGNNIPVTWALDIVGYDWWIGIATGGLLVSALMLLTDAPGRAAFVRLGQSVAVFSTVAAGLYPIVHLGRPWFFYWNLPYPNLLDLWPQFRSPLAWDAMAILSLLGISLLSWYGGMLPDFAVLRDRTAGWWRPRLYGIAALGWRGSALQWQRWMELRRVHALCGLLVVVSLQSGAAVMYAGTVEPGWHDTLLPVTFLCGAVFSGLAAMTLISVVVRAALEFAAAIPTELLDRLGWWLLAAGLSVTYCHVMEVLFTEYGGDRYELAVTARRLTGIYAWSAWVMIVCALLPIHLLWFGRLRRSGPVLAGVGLLVLVGTWTDHFTTIVVTLHHDFLPSSSHLYVISIWAVGLFVGTVGLFLACLLLFLRFLPAISVTEARRG